MGSKAQLTRHVALFPSGAPLRFYTQSISGTTVVGVNNL